MTALYDRYTTLLKHSLVDYLHVDDPLANACPIDSLVSMTGLKKWKWDARAWVARKMSIIPARIDRRSRAQRRHDREHGLDWPILGQTMTGLKRLNALQGIVETVIKEKVPGDLLETGVWRGGSCILMKAIVELHDETDRKVWVCDSFEGLPPPDINKWEHDAGDVLYQHDMLRISQEQVAGNFEKYNLLDDRVKFVKGFFEDTLPDLDPGPLAVLRLDGDMYGSTMVALESLYDNVSKGGFIIVDDYFVQESCKQAIADFCEKRGITANMEQIDQDSVWWRKA